MWHLENDIVFFNGSKEICSVFFKTKGLAFSQHTDEAFRIADSLSKVLSDCTDYEVR